MKNFGQFLSLTLTASLVLAPNAFSQSSAASCDGLQSSAGNFSENHNKRQNLNKKLCEENGLKKIVDGVRKNLKPCEDLGTDLKGKNHGINVDIFFPDVKEQIEKSCKVHDHYDKTAQALCTQYGETAKSAQGTADATRSAALGSGQAGDFNQIAGLHGDLVPKYKLYGASMNSMGKDVKKNMPGLKDGVDTKMDETVRRLRQQIQALTKAKREQISAQGQNRSAIAGAQGDDASMRLRTQADVKKFWTNLVKCEAVAKDNGSLDKFNKTYQATMAKSLGVATKEAEDLSKSFYGQADEHLAAQRSAEKTARALGPKSGSAMDTAAPKAYEGHQARPKPGKRPPTLSTSHGTPGID